MVTTSGEAEDVMVKDEPLAVAVRVWDESAGVMVQVEPDRVTVTGQKDEEGVIVKDEPERDIVTAESSVERIEAPGACVPTVRAISFSPSC